MKTNREKALIVLGVFLTLTVSLSVSIMGRSPEAFDLVLFMRYALVGLLGALYSYVLLFARFNYALNVFYVGLVLSVLVVVFGFTKPNEAFADLGTLLMWIIVLLASVVLGLVYQLIMHFYNKKKGL